MSFDRKINHESPIDRKFSGKRTNIKNVYWGEVVSIVDTTEGGIIKVRIPELDTKTPNENLPDCYPFIPKFIHLYPKVGEVVRIILEDFEYPQRSRFWVGTVISQLQKINYDGLYTALNTTNIGRGTPDKALSQYPKAKGVFPSQNEIALIGRDNTDVILRDKQVEIRAGKHEYDDVFSLNKKNPASMSLTFEKPSGGTETRSLSLILADKIALISHDGIPKFKAADVDEDERNRIIENGHPMVRGDVLAEILEIFRKAIFEHIHPYAKMPSDKSGIILDLEKVDLESIKQNNIVIN